MASTGKVYRVVMTSMVTTELYMDAPSPELAVEKSKELGLGVELFITGKGRVPSLFAKGLSTIVQVENLEHERDIFVEEVNQ